MELQLYQYNPLLRLCHLEAGAVEVQAEVGAVVVGATAEAAMMGVAGVVKIQMTQVAL